MKAFTQLFAELDGTNKTSEKIAALKRYLQVATPADAAWAVYLLSGRKVRQLIPIRRLCEWAIEQAQIPPWLFEECYESVGDLAETVSLVLPETEAVYAGSLAELVEGTLAPLRDADPEIQRKELLDLWGRMSRTQSFVLHKLITGSFRVGVSQRLVTRALSQHTGIEGNVIAHRLAGDWQPSTEFFQSLVDPQETSGQVSQPYPFFLAHPIENDLQTLGACFDWQAEWKWDGIRAQLIRRDEETFIWSRGDELMTDRFPELKAAAQQLGDGTVLDGEVLAWRDGVLPFAVMQRRIGRKQLGKKILAEAPVILMAFDLLEYQGTDVRNRPLTWRRQQLVKIVQRLRAESHDESCPILLSERVTADSWKQLAEIRESSRARGTEGLMLKRKESAYGVGRTRGDWWKWKIDPYTVDAVLIYAQRGSGRRASLYTDYTFAVWQGDQLVPFAKAYSGLTDEEIREVDSIVRQTTVERFGPVRSVEPQLVFEIAFEKIQLSRRHKSGIAVRFPRIVRWRRDKQIAEADTLEGVKSLIEPQSDAD